MSEVVFNREKFDELIGRGLCYGTGNQNTQVCIEVAIAIACGEEPTDRPTCVHRWVRSFAIRLNDSNWSSPAARAKGLTALGIAQLGSASWTDDEARSWVRAIVVRSIREVLPIALRAAKLEEQAVACEQATDLPSAHKAAKEARAAARAAYAYAYAAAAADAAAAAAAARDRVLTLAATIAAEECEKVHTARRESKNEKQSNASSVN